MNDASASTPDEAAMLAGQRRVLELIARGAPPIDTLSAVAKFAEEMIPGVLASILAYDRVDGVLRRGGYASLPPSFAEAVDGLVPGPAAGSCGTAAHRREQVISDDIATDPLWNGFHEFAESYGIAAGWSTPLLGADDGELLGVFGMYYRAPRRPTEAELAIVTDLASLATIALQRHHEEERQRREALNDPLTGLANRRRIRELLVAGNGNGDAARERTVALLDFEQVRRFDGQFGRLLGDRRLVEIAFQLQGSLGAAILARFEGDTFAALIEAPDDRARSAVEGALEAFSLPISFPGTDLRAAVGVGMVHIHGDVDDVDELLYHANEATRRSTQMGGGRVVVFGDDERRAASQRRRIERLLFGLISDERVVAHFQPIVSLSTGRTIGLEALARLEGDDVADVSPAVFIPVAEESNLIEAIGAAMLRRSCEALAGHRDELDGLTMHVNVSVRQLMNPSFTTEAAAVVVKYGLHPRRICFEVTESQWLDRTSPARATIDELRRRGFRIALDDFGTGYASLSYLQELPFTEVKYDGSFIARLGIDEPATALCSAARSMAHACGMTMIAESVETAEQAAIVRDLGYDAAQGWHFGSVMPLDQLLAWLSEHPAD
jgi:diguanylate cyclase (GGDEF)-like protein